LEIYHDVILFRSASPSPLPPGTAAIPTVSKTRARRRVLLEVALS